MNPKTWLLLAAAVAAAALAGSAAAQPGPQYSKDALTVAHDDNAFALDLYGQLRHKKGNLFFSPYSISSALAMTYAGAKGETADAMAKTLHFALPADRFHPAFSELVHGFNARGEKRPYQLNVANALWGQKGFTFLPAFLKVAQDQYEAGLKEVNFAKETEAARQTINAWVEDKTQNKIKELLKPGMVNSGTSLVLTNAIYFKSSWGEAFKEANTRQEGFTLADGEKVKVPMMSKNDRLMYGEGDNYQMVNIPYKDYALSMLVLLPKKADGLAELEKALTAKQLEQWQQKMVQCQVNLKLPKFKTTSEFKLKEQLTQLGMGIAFSGKANFSGMTSQESLMIDEVVHKAYVDVNEKGTEAAAATAVIMAPTGLPAQLKRVSFHADRPFVFLIRENRTGSILFIGRIENPKS